MNCRVSIWLPGLLLALLAAGAGRGMGQEQHGRSIEISTTKDDQAATNTVANTRRQLRDGALQEQARDGILKPFSPGGDSLEAISAMPYVPPQPTLSADELRQLKEHIQERRSWLYGDAAANSSAETDKGASDNRDDALNGPGASKNGLERDTISLLKQQYMDLENKRLSGTNYSAQNDPSANDDSDNNNDPTRGVNSLTGERRNHKGKSGDHSNDRSNDKNDQQQDQNPLKRMFESQDMAVPGGLAMPKNLFSDAFGSSSAVMPKPTAQEEQRASDFQKLLNGSASGSGPRAGSLNPLGDPNGISAGGQAGGAAGLADSQSMPTMAAMPGYSPGSSLSPALASPVSSLAPAPAPLIQPAPPPLQFNKSFGPPQRQF